MKTGKERTEMKRRLKHGYGWDEMPEIQEHLLNIGLRNKPKTNIRFQY